MTQIGVLLVDDHPSFAHIARRFLQQDRQVCVLGLMSSKQSLLPAVRATKPNIVLVDLGMADPCILDEIAELRSCLPDLGIIALTLFDAVGYREAALAAGANDFIVKDSLYRLLLPAIHRMMPEPMISN
jgi:DNA-binding NarL/FixJ family response regulator